MPDTLPVEGHYGLRPQQPGQGASGLRHQQVPNDEHVAAVSEDRATATWNSPKFRTKRKQKTSAERFLGLLVTQVSVRTCARAAATGRRRRPPPRPGRPAGAAAAPAPPPAAPRPWPARTAGTAAAPARADATHVRLTGVLPALHARNVMLCWSARGRQVAQAQHTDAA